LVVVKSLKPLLWCGWNRTKASGKGEEEKKREKRNGG
jgi:hypothetical protein